MEAAIGTQTGLLSRPSISCMQAGDYGALGCRFWGFQASNVLTTREIAREVVEPGVTK